MSFLTTIIPAAQDMGRKYNILPSLILAQAALESNYGTSGLAVNGKNLFGIKGSFQGQCVKMNTHEYEGGNVVTIQAPFRKYPTWEDSIEDLCLLYVNNVRYHNIIGVKDINLAVTLPYKDGYCTDPNYGKSLLAIVNQWQLWKYDNPAPAYPGILKQGSRGDNVKLIQKQLGIPADGIFGPQTAASVKSFQLKNHLAADGIVGPQTWDKLF